MRNKVKLNYFQKTNLYIRSLIYWFFSINEVVIFSFFCLLASPFSLNTRHAVLRTFLKINLTLLKLFCNVRYTVRGLEHLQGHPYGIVLCKHQSTYETFWLPQFFQNPAVIVKRELQWIPFFGWGLATSSPIAINRGDTKSAMQQVMEQGKKCLKNKRWVVFFPEGTRVAPGTTGKYRLGGARLAVETGEIVIPVAHNAGYIWRRRGLIKYPGVVTFVIGPPIETKNKSPEIILEEAKQWIEDTVAQLGDGRDVLFRKPGQAG